MSYFTIPTLKTITRFKQLKDALETLRSMTQKVDFFKVVHQYVWYWLWDGYSDAVL